MKDITIKIGTLEIGLDFYRNYTIPEKPSDYFVELVNFVQTQRFLPPVGLIKDKLGVNAARVSQYERVLLNEGLLIGERRKGNLLISQESFINKSCARDLVFFRYLEKKGNRRYIPSSLPESGIFDLKACLKEETGIDEECLSLQIEVLRNKRYLREDANYLVINQQRWIKETLIVKNLYENGFEEYDLPAKFVSGVQDYLFLMKQFLKQIYPIHWSDNFKDFSVFESFLQFAVRFTFDKVRDDRALADFRSFLERMNLPSEKAMFEIIKIAHEVDNHDWISEKDFGVMSYFGEILNKLFRLFLELRNRGEA